MPVDPQDGDYNIFVSDYEAIIAPFSRLRNVQEVRIIMIDEPWASSILENTEHVMTGKDPSVTYIK
jgi:hypothetical protein